MKEIQPISIWSNGQQKSGTVLNMYSINDNLSTSATFYYSILVDSVSNERVAEGNLTMDGQDYIDWGAATDINDEAFVWAAGKLNLTLV